jgi:two-component system, OmpR family, sensor histidine kinase VicK
MSSVALQSETLRLQALEQYEVFNTPADPALDDISRLAAQCCGATVAGIALMDGERRVYRAIAGLYPMDQPRGNTPCETTLLGDTIFEIRDALQHPAYMPDGILLGGRHFRFYAGAPLTTPAGVNIGTLFVLDIVPRRLTPVQANALAILGRQIITRFELVGRVRQMDLAARAHQRTDSALTVERNFVSAVLDTVGALVAVFDTAGRIVRFNRACETISGYNFDELVGGYVWDKLIPADDIPEAIATFKSIRAGGMPAAFENHWISAQGTLHRIAWSVTALADEQNQVAFIIATGIDVTTQHAAESTLRESEARYRQLVEGSLGMVFTHDLNGVLLSVNRHGAESIGRTREEMAGRTLSEFMPPEFASSFPVYLGLIRDTGEAQGLLHLSHPSGDVHVIAYRNKLIDVPGYGPYVLGFGVDITEKVRAEDKLRSLIRQSNSILESVGDGIYGIDLEGQVTVVNPAAAQMLGYKPHEMLGKPLHELIHHTHADGTPYPPEDCPIINSLKNLDTVRVSNDIFWRKDGTSFPVDYVARPQIDTGSDAMANPGAESGYSQVRAAAKAVGVVVAFTDITERRALDRMKDEFISTVSHELRTPLTSLRAALGLIGGGALSARPEKMHQMLDIAVGNTDRLVRLVNDILDLERIGSGKAELHFTMCSAGDLLRRAAELQQADAAKARIRFTFDAPRFEVWADPDRILQTITNLISNAVKFSQPGSVVQLSARALDEEEARIEIRDQGRGIPEDKLEHIFERFQQVDASDSRAKGGTGLGLAICRSIVQQHGGHIWATSTPGKGSTFYFTLPTKPSSHLR